MKYESNILKRLIDTYGVVGNPRYISEIIKEFIVKGKERFPELFTYQADWLAHIDEFGLNPTYTVSYTGQSIYAPNTLEKPVKSAILKGSTKYRDIDTGEILEAFEEGRNLELVSVKMPVLTTTGKNLFDGELELGDIGFNDGIQTQGDFAISKNFNVINGGVNVICSIESSVQGRIYYYDGNKNYISTTLVANLEKTPQNAKYFKLRFNKEFLNSNIMMGYGTSNISYEPYKSNILTVNEDVELRGIGDVKDELDLLTGEVIERIGEVVLDGSEDEKWTLNNSSMENTIVFHTNYFSINNTINPVCDKFVYNSIGVGENGDFEHFRSNGNFQFIFINKNRLDSEDVNGFKLWLSQNPITIQYRLATESIKTVDLTILDQNGQNVKQLMSFNGGTHFNTGSLEGSLLPSVSVSVETDLEETLKVCSLEGNTM